MEHNAAPGLSDTDTALIWHGFPFQDQCGCPCKRCDGEQLRFLSLVKGKSTEWTDWQFHCIGSSGNLSLSCWQALVRKNSSSGRLKIIRKERGKGLVHPCKTCKVPQCLGPSAPRHPLLRQTHTFEAKSQCSLSAVLNRTHLWEQNTVTEVWLLHRHCTLNKMGSKTHGSDTAI